MRRRSHSESELLRMRIMRTMCHCTMMIPLFVLSGMQGATAKRQPNLTSFMVTDELGSHLAIGLPARFHPSKAERSKPGQALYSSADKETIEVIIARAAKAEISGLKRTAAASVNG